MIAIVMWVMTALAITGFFLNMKMNKWGYIFWIVSNAGFVVNDLYAKQYPQAGLFAFYVVMCIVGFIQWSNKESKSDTTQKRLVILQKTLDKNFKRGDVCYWIIGGGKSVLKNIGTGKQRVLKSGEDFKKEEIGLAK